MGADPTTPSRTPGSLVLVARYGLALALALVAVGLALLLEPLTGAAFFGITVASVAGAALLAGVGPAIAAAAVALAGHMLLVRPPLSTDPAAREDVWQLVFALIASAVVVAAGGAARRARERERAGRERVAESLRREHEMLLALQA
ncbi:MAG TPA: DUF4118 domain-containing protein, partial [Miltoncostaeaceae bacterium]|nr:DUF4118 domain-containing protein [Miltoncostaeaceae bacterium]